MQEKENRLREARAVAAAQQKLREKQTAQAMAKQFLMTLQSNVWMGWSLDGGWVLCVVSKAERV